MLDSFFRRAPEKSSPAVASNSDHSKTARPHDDSDKLTALGLADSLPDEAAAVDFILTCRFADARLRAAEQIQSRPLLEKVLQAMRKTDRRVAKLVQERLDVMVKQELIADHAQECIVAAQALLQEVPLIPNRVADMDRNWRSIGEVGDPHGSVYALLREELDAKLAAQAALQRAVIDALEDLRKISGAAQDLTADQLTQALSRAEEQLVQFRNAPEVPSLPRNLLPEFEQVVQVLALQRASHNHKELADAAQDAASNQTLDVKPDVVLADRLPDRTAQTSSVSVTELDAEAAAAFAQMLDAMEQAVQAGALQSAAERDESLRAMDLQKCQPDARQITRLSSVRADLKRLQGWARWSGNVSREGLIREAEALSVGKIQIQTLAKSVGGARERWKSLDAASGAAPKALWLRFDAACRTAYAPVAERVKKQAQERQQNRMNAEKLIADLTRSIEASGLSGEGEGSAVTDWKSLANVYRTSMQAWQRIGHMDRKDQKALDAQFRNAAKPLLHALRQQWKIEIEKRQSLIAQAESIGSDDRKAIDRVRLLQQHWQEAAKALPLERSDEQALWQRFRTACNTVFAEKKQVNKAADAERERNAEACEALSAALEACVNESEAAIRKLLRETDIAWRSIGAVPRARESHIEARRRNATAALQTKLDAIKQAEKVGQSQALREKLTLCQAAESALVAGAALDSQWQERWQTLPALQTAREGVMRRRFDAAINALLVTDRAYAARLKSNVAVLQQELLRAEILAGVDSPPELSRQRMQAQIAVLQASLSGNKAASLPEILERLYALPALSDEQSMKRMLHLLKS